MQPEFHIREYSSDDYHEMISLWESLGLGGVHRGDDSTIIQHTIEMGGKLLLMFDKQTNKMIGTSWLTIDGRRVYLHHFGIHTDFQGKKLADPLLQASLKYAKSTGLQIKLEVHKNNEKALGLYQKSGFKYLGDYHVYIIRDISAI